MAYEKIATITSKRNSRVTIDTVIGSNGQTRFILQARKQFMFIEPKDLDDVADLLDELIDGLDH